MVVFDPGLECAKYRDGLWWKRWWFGCI